MHDPFEGGGHGHTDLPLPVEMEEKLPRLVRELKGLVSHLKDLRLRGNPEPLPPELSHVEKNRLLMNVLKALLTQDRPGLKRNVAQRVASRIGDYMLWHRSTSTPVIHELITLLAWWTDKVPNEAMTTLRDLALEFTISGNVVPIQTVWSEILESPVMFIGHCVCRSAGIVNDLRDSSGKVFTLTSEEESNRLLNRLMGRYDQLVEKHGTLPDTDDKFKKLFQRLKKYRDTGDPKYRIETLIQQTYGTWEFLPVLDTYTQSWIRGMQKNRKAHLVHKSLAFEMANILFLSRGVMFTSMKCVDTPYTICSCPTPDTGGGCVLSNWYYYGLSNTSITPNETAYGRRKDEFGNVLPCNVFPERSTRGCMGCGCLHGAPNPRGVDTVLNQADEILKKYGKF